MTQPAATVLLGHRQIDRIDLATTVLDRQHYLFDDLADRCHGRWSSEELYTIANQLLPAEEFSDQTKRTVQLELRATSA